jgi:hypothetical protein
VPDWAAIVGSRLGALGLDPAREEEVRAELAAHLEDLYAEARRRGSADAEATARALERVPDWSHLARIIRRADRRDGSMSRDAKTIWVPGMAALAGAAAVILASTLLPSSLWADRRADVPMALAAIAIYLACGALGAAWSRRAGGTIRDRLCAGLLPLALHVAIFVLALVVATVSDGRPHPETVLLNLQLRVAVVFLVIPGIALAIGTLPFLRDA